MNGNYRMRQYMKEHLPLYLFVSVLFVMGVVFGALMVGALSPGQKQEMARHVNSFIQIVNQGESFGGKTTFWDSFSLHLKWVGLIWVLGLSVIGLPFIFLLDFLKGVLVGFSVGYLVGQLSWKGMLFAFVSIAPQNLIVIPALVMCSVAACAFSLYVIKNRFMQKRGALYPTFMRYTSLSLCMAALLFAVALFEAYLSPVMIKWVAPMLAVTGG
ncbi:stage II sporulation protein M [Paenibacillus flagellatus]|uniref:Stage II sporulation protein M n=1 Tax=Paenibacillus flagellatus TaxID=2211139 RepID=A0A2V5KAC3_9BACL|nr:stage II sporulation protein M [Paenibacillus flagellatus]PYI55024.1 stage II sporulation protein M [Paenibacillus flagellatus]